MKSKLNFLALASVFVTLPWYISWNSISIILAVCVSAVVFFFSPQKKIKFHPAYLLPILYFGLVAASSFLSQDVQEGYKVIEKNLAFIALPIVFLITDLSSVDGRKLPVLFAYSSTFALVVALTIALSKILFLGAPIGDLFYHNLSLTVGIHAIYLSFYLAAGVFIYWLAPESFLLKSKGRLILIAINVLGILLLSSKNIIITFAAIALVYGFLSLKNKAKPQWYVGLVVMSILAGVAFISLTPTYQRFTRSINEFRKDLIFAESYEGIRSFNGPTIRLILWRLSFEILDEQKGWIFGVGIGDANEVRRLKAEEYHIYQGKKEDPEGWPDYTRYNAHNQYVDSLYTLGLFGEGFFLAMLITMLAYAYKAMPMILPLVVLLVFFSITESTLFVQKGIVPFALFFSLLVKLKSIDK